MGYRCVHIHHDSPHELHRLSLETARAVLACGVNPNQSILYRQSQVLEHTNLAWLLGCVTPMSWLQRMVSVSRPCIVDRTFPISLPTFHRYITKIRHELLLIMIPVASSHILYYKLLISYCSMLHMYLWVRIKGNIWNWHVILLSCSIAIMFAIRHSLYLRRLYGLPRRSSASCEFGLDCCGNSHPRTKVPEGSDGQDEQIVRQRGRYHLS